MKTPDDIKKDAETCMNHPHTYSCNSCQLYGECHGIAEHIIKELYDLVVSYESRLAQVERERDALVHFIQKESFPAVISSIPEACQWCKHLGDFTKEICKFCGSYEVYGNFEWRGVCSENTKEDADENTEKV